MGPHSQVSYKITQKDLFNNCYDALLAPKTKRFAPFHKVEYKRDGRHKHSLNVVQLDWAY